MFLWFTFLPPGFPRVINPTKEFGYILGALAGDGYLNKNCIGLNAKDKTKGKI